MKNETQHKERPILFSAPMVQAILEGRKTMTRREVKCPQLIESNYPANWICKTGYSGGYFGASFYNSTDDQSTKFIKCPYGRPGDRLWVRETFCWPEDYSTPIYRADGGELPSMECWRPSIHMPRAASRILLEITEIRVERLHDISEQDAKAEGVEVWAETLPDPEPFTARSAPSQIFSYLWQSINGLESWDKNPWVWAITFKRI